MKKILLQGIGNPSRGDDALGPLFIEKFTDPAVEKEWVYQLQVEHAEQWSHYDTVIVVDAHANLAEPMVWRELEAAADANLGITSHQVAPETVLALNQAYFAPHRPQVFLLGLQAESFELGAELTSRARQALAQGLEYLESTLV